MSDQTPSSWMHGRLQHTTDALRRAASAGLTSHTFRERRGKQVVLEDGSRAVEFMSCSYLGLEEHPEVVGAAMEAAATVGVQFAASRTRMRHVDLVELERTLSVMYSGWSVTCFTSVGNVHLGVLPLLLAGALPSYPVRPGGVAVLIERTAHASMQVLRGVLEPFGPVQRWSLDDLDHLRDVLHQQQAAGRTPVVLVDGIGSMGGLVDVRSLHELCVEVGGYVYVDDAHGISVAGDQGAGYVFTEFLGKIPHEVILVGGMAKGFGGVGGFVVLRSAHDTDVVCGHANPLLFGGPLTLPMVAANLASARLHVAGELPPWQRTLWQNTELFDQMTQGALVNAGERSPVRGMAYATEEEGLQAALRLRDQGVLVTPAFYPTVARGTSLVRFAVSALHTRAQILAAARGLGYGVLGVVGTQVADAGRR